MQISAVLYFLMYDRQGITFYRVSSPILDWCGNGNGKCTIPSGLVKNRKTEPREKPNVFIIELSQNILVDPI